VGISHFKAGLHKNTHSDFCLLLCCSHTLADDISNKWPTENYVSFLSSVRKIQTGLKGMQNGAS